MIKEHTGGVKILTITDIILRTMQHVFHASISPRVNFFLWQPCGLLALAYSVVLLQESELNEIRHPRLAWVKQGLEVWGGGGGGGGGEKGEGSRPCTYPNPVTPYGTQRSTMYPKDRGGRVQVVA